MSLRYCEARLAVDPTEIALQPTGYWNGEQLGDFVWMQLAERAPQPFDATRASLEQQYCFGFIGNLAFPAVDRARLRQNGAAGDESAVEQLTNERYRLVIRGDCRKHNYRVSMRQENSSQEVATR